MSDPIVFVSRHGILEGKVEAFREAYNAAKKHLKAEKPGTVAFLAYTDEDESQVTTVHVFPDADAMDHHLEGVEERAGGAAEFLEFREFEIYGSTNEETMAIMDGYASSDVTLTIDPNYVTGYLRLGEQ